MDPVTTHAAIHVAFLTAETIGADVVEKLRTIRARGAQPLSLEDRFVIERAYALMREYCFYYAALMPSFASGLISFTARQALLVRIRELYTELVALRRTLAELQADPWFDIERYFAATLTEWIDALNTAAPHYTVEPLGR